MKIFRLRSYSDYQRHSEAAVDFLKKHHDFLDIVMSDDTTEFGCISVESFVFVTVKWY
jgi:hypothetical protein